MHVSLIAVFAGRIVGSSHESECSWSTDLEQVLWSCYNFSWLFISPKAENTFDSMQRYCDSKLAQVLAAKEFQRRFDRWRTQVNLTLLACLWLLICAEWRELSGLYLLLLTNRDHNSWKLKRPRLCVTGTAMETVLSQLWVFILASFTQILAMVTSREWFLSQWGPWQILWCNTL